MKRSAAGTKIGRLLRAGMWSLAISPALFAQQQPPPPPQAPLPQQQAAPTAAPPEISADDPDYGEPITVFYWATTGFGKLLPGKKAAVPANQRLDNLGKPKSRTFGGSISIPAGKFNHLELSYFQGTGNGTGTATTTLSFFGSTIPDGDFIASSYRIRNVQLLWNYLTWPAPPEDSKFRLRTLYGFDYASENVVVDAPFEPNPSFTTPNGTRNIFYPTFGIEGEYIPSKHLFFEARTWGFALPHKAVLGDAEVNMTLRYKHLEIFAGYKYFHMKSSPNNDLYVVQTLKGATGGLRWVLR